MTMSSDIAAYLRESIKAYRSAPGYMGNQVIAATAQTINQAMAITKPGQMASLQYDMTVNGQTKSLHISFVKQPNGAWTVKEHPFRKPGHFIIQKDAAEELACAMHTLNGLPILPGKD